MNKSHYRLSIKSFILLLTLLLLNYNNSYSQCSVSINPPAPNLPCDDATPVTLCAVPTVSDIDQSQTNYNGGTSARTLAGYSIFQSFTAGVTGTLIQIDMGFFNFINGIGTLKIFQGAGTGGTLLSSQIITVFCGGGNCLLSFPVNVPITAGSTYTFQFIPGAGIPDPYGVQVEVPGTYSGGYFGLIDPSGTYNTGFDMVFKTHVKTTISYLWSNSATDSCIDVYTGGIFTVTITTSPVVCTKTANVNISGVPPPPNVNAGPDKVISCSFPTVVLNGSSSTPGVTYIWTGPGIVSGGNTATPTVNAAGTYTLTVRQISNGCTSSDQAVVTASFTPPNANAGPDKVITCSTSSVVLNGSSTTAGVTYSWSGPGIVSGANTATPTVNSAGTYTLTITETSSGCTNTDQAVVTLSTTPPNANAGPDKTISCSSPTVVLNGSSTTAGVTYSWAGPGIVSGANTAAPTVNAAGTYTLTVTQTSNSCTNTDQAVVTASTSVPNANAGPDKTLTCTVLTVVLNGSSTTAGVTFSWAGPGIVSGANTATPTVNSAGTYTLTVTETSTGCMNIDQAVVSSSTTPPNANAGPDKIITCSTPAVVLNGSSTTAGVTYSWAGPGIVSGANTPSPTVNTAGTYTLTVTETSTGCSKTDQAVVTASNTLPNANAGPDKTLTCSTPTAVLNGSSSTAGVTFSWTGPGIVSGANTATPTVNAAGTYTLTVTETSTGCTSTDQAVVTSFISLPNANAGPDKTIDCSNPSVMLNGSSTTAGVTFSWTGPSIASGANTATPTVNAVGTYILTVTQTSTGCSNTDQAVVTSTTALPNANAGADMVLTCTVTTVILNGSSSTPGVTFSWTGPGIVSGANTPTPTVNASGTYTLTVTQTSNGCSNSDQAAVTSSTAQPNADAGPDKTITCGSATVILNGSSTTPGVTYTWAGPGIVSGGNTATPTVNSAGTYTLTVTQPGTGCSSTDAVTVSNGISILTLNATTKNNYCLGDTTGEINITLLSGTPPFQFNWSNGSNTEDLTGLSKGNYHLTITDKNQCRKDTSFSIIDLGISATARPDTILDYGDSVTLTGETFGITGIRSILWQPDSFLSCTNCLEPIASPLHDIEYIFTAIDSNNCTASDTIRIKVLPLIIKGLIFPNAFTPNNDNLNDVFGTLGDIKHVLGYEMHIFDRWGEQLMISTDVHEGWDGTYKNEPASMDTYVYYAKATFLDNSVRYYKGIVVLVR